jgi:hypothetical protein
MVRYIFHPWLTVTESASSIMDTCDDEDGRQKLDARGRLFECWLA